jgi:hypothetical protein
LHILPRKEPGTKGMEAIPHGFPKIASTTSKLLARRSIFGGVLH